MKTIRILFLLIFVSLMPISSLFAESSVNEKDALKFLDNSVKPISNCLISKTTQNVIDAEIFGVSLSVNLGDEYNNIDIAKVYVLKTVKGNSLFSSLDTLVASVEFVNSIKSEFVLKTAQDGMTFRSLLVKCDNSTREGFFQKGKAWYFIKKKFFDDIEGFEVITNEKGNIKSIKYNNKMNISLPDNMMGNQYAVPLADPAEKFAEAEMNKMVSNLRKKANYSFHLKKIDIPNFTTANDIYNGTLAITENYPDGGSSTGETDFVLIGNNNKYSIEQNIEKLFGNEMFAAAVKENYTIKTDAQAKSFQNFIDLISLKKEDIPKKYYKKDGFWFFVREKMFESSYGVMVKTGDDGSISYLGYGEISDQNIMRFRMNNEDVKIDFAFKLVKPKKTDITINESEKIPVEITFNAIAASAKGAWILTRINSEMAGFHAGTSLESPFKNEISGKELGKGTHKVEYLLIPEGPNTDNPLGVVSLDVVVK